MSDAASFSQARAMTTVACDKGCGRRPKLNTVDSWTVNKEPVARSDVFTGEPISAHLWSLTCPDCTISDSAEKTTEKE